jgi:hypothetical protein
MPTRRTPLRRQATQRVIPQAAIEAWMTGQRHDCDKALGIRPWEYGVFPCDLPDEQPDDNTGLCIVESWPRIKALQDELYHIAGEPGSPRD